MCVSGLEYYCTHCVSTVSIIIVSIVECVHSKINNIPKKVSISLLAKYTSSVSLFRTLLYRYGQQLKGVLLFTCMRHLLLCCISAVYTLVLL